MSDIESLVGRTLRYTPGTPNAYRRVFVEDAYGFDGGQLKVRIENAPSVGMAVPTYAKKTTLLPASLLDRGILELLRSE